MLAAACGTADTDAATAAAASSSPSAAGDALTFTSTTTEGAVFDADDVAGKDVVLWFWAPWCTICRAEAPQVTAAAEQVSDVTVIGVASGGTLQEMQTFVEETGSGSITHLADVDGEVWRAFEVVAQPTFVFVDDDGRTQTFSGGLPQQTLVDAMQQLGEV